MKITEYRNGKISYLNIRKVHRPLDLQLFHTRIRKALKAWRCRKSTWAIKSIKL